MPALYLGDWVLRAIAAEVAAHPPERGGALLGPPQRPLVTHFVADPQAATTSASFRPSRALDARVKQLEVEDGLELKGIVHSHPRGLDRPSEHDAAELATGLRLNGHMASYLAPIVTVPLEGELARHELALGGGKISFFAGHRTRSGGAQVRPCRVHLVPLLRDLERVARRLGCATPEPIVSDAGSGPILMARFALDGGVELLLLASEHHPAMPPVLLATTAGAGTEQLHVPWRLDAAPEERLEQAVAEAFEGPGPHRAAFGPRAGPPLTADPDRAARAGWSRRFTSRDPERETEALRAALFARAGGVLPDTLRERAVLVAGCGSVGSYVAEQLARAGVGALTLVDPDRVEAVNLSRTVYQVDDVGRPKVDALARRLLNVSPALRVEAHHRAVEDLDAQALDAIVRGADLVVAATDDPASQRVLDRFAQGRGRPGLFPALYAGAEGGEVVITVPGRTPCYVCATATRHRAEEGAGRVAPVTDYGTGRLRAEPALGPDIQHVASAAVKLALGLLVPEGSPVGARRLLDEALAERLTYLTLSTVPRYWFYPALFGEVPGQAAFQSVWLTPASRPGCTVCGAPEHRVDPLEVPLRSPGRDAVLAAARELTPTGERTRGVQR